MELYEWFCIFGLNQKLNHHEEIKHSEKKTDKKRVERN